MPTSIWIHATHRSFLGKYKGALSSLRADDLVVQLLNHHAHFRPEALYLGCANQAGEDSRNIARLAVLLSNLPETTPAVTVNSLCGSSTHALEYAYLQLKTQRFQTLWAGGVEQMTRSPLACLPPHIDENAVWEDSTFGWRFRHPDFDGNVAGRSMLHHADVMGKDLCRERLDAVALQSHRRAIEHQALSTCECLALYDSQGLLLLEQDEGVRPNLSAETLSRLKPVREGGIHTPAHLAPYADGVAGAVLSSVLAPFCGENYDETVAIELIDIVQIATPPAAMPLAGLEALNALLEKHAVTLDEVASFEFHEAFASAYVLQCDALGLDAFSDSRLNRRGGSLALGSPMGATALRSVCTLAHRLHGEGDESRPYGVATISVGMGLGSAVLLKRHDVGRVDNHFHTN
ncbi:MAG: thiolase family protein [Vampirovibrionales bacterium]